MNVASELRDQLHIFDEHLQTLGRSSPSSRFADLDSIQVNNVPLRRKMVNFVQQ